MNELLKKMNQEKNGAIYIRVSTHMQEELSPDAQKRLILDYAKSNSISVLPQHIYVENGVSGRTASKRPQFQQMISDAKSKSHPFDVILVWKFSRFARNQEESIVYKSLLKKQCNIDVVSVSEPLADGPFGSLIERIIEWMDEYYSIRLSGEVFRGMSEKAKRGGYLARPPLGYRIDKPKEPPVIVPEEAETVRLIFDMYVNRKMGMFDISQELNRRNLKTANHKPFERRTVEYILKNPVYCGLVRWNMTKSEDKSMKPEDEWIIREGGQEAIITKELYDAAQERFKSTYKPRGTRPSVTYRHWLSGLLKCPKCGRTMIAKHTRSNHKTYCYFVCYGFNKGNCDDNTYLSSRVIEKEILQAIKDVMDTGELDFEYIEPATDDSYERETLEALEDMLKRISVKEKRIKEAYIGGIDTIDEYKENKLLLSQEKENILKEIDKLQKTLSGNTEDKTPDMLNRIHSVYDFLISDADNKDKNEAIKSIIEKIIYDKSNNSIDILYYYNQ